MTAKKVIASVLVLMMFVSVGVAFAQYFSEVGANATAKAVADLKNLNIMIGDPNGDFRGESTITRAEISTILCRINGFEELAKTYSGTATFTDTENHWAKNYIELCKTRGYINGFPEGDFRPEEMVTVGQALTMLVRVLGYEDNDVRAKGFPYGYTTKAEEIGFASGANLKPYYLSEKQSLPATRNFIAFLISNALDIPLRELTYSDMTTGFEEHTVFDGKNGTELKTLRKRVFGGR